MKSVKNLKILGVLMLSLLPSLVFGQITSDSEVTLSAKTLTELDATLMILKEDQKKCDEVLEKSPETSEMKAIMSNSIRSKLETLRKSVDDIQTDLDLVERKISAIVSQKEELEVLIENCLKK